MATADDYIDSQLSRISELFSSSLYSDIELQCGEKVWNLHKAIVCTMSPVINKACEKDESTNVVVIGNHQVPFDYSSDDPIAVDMMLQFMYRRNYQPGSNPYNYEGDNIEMSMMSDILSLHAKVYMLGEKYQVPLLGSRALESFRHDAKKMVWNDQSFCILGDVIFTTLSDMFVPLKECVVELLHLHGKQQGMSKVLREYVGDTPELASRLLKYSYNGDGRGLVMCSVTGRGSSMAGSTTATASHDRGLASAPATSKRRRMSSDCTTAGEPPASPVDEFPSLSAL